jgi:hypothetical protein
MVSSILLLLIVGIVIFIVNVTVHTTASSQSETQAYYTARTVNERIANWLEGTSSVYNAQSGWTNQQEFIYGALSSSTHEPSGSGGLIYDSAHKVVQPYGEAELGGEMGTAEAVVSINSDDAEKPNSVITIEVTGHFADMSETVTSTLALNQAVNFQYQDLSFAYAENPVASVLANVEQLGTWQSQSVLSYQLYADLSASSNYWSYFFSHSQGSFDPDGVLGNQTAISPIGGAYYVTLNGHVYKVGEGELTPPAYSSIFLYELSVGPSDNICAFIDFAALPLESQSDQNLQSLKQQTSMSSYPERLKQYGILLGVSAGTTVPPQGRITYYTGDQPGSAPLDITLSDYASTASVPQVYQGGLSLYLNDTSDKKLLLPGGVQVQQGLILYSKRATTIGGPVSLSTSLHNTIANGAAPGGNADMKVTGASYLVFADPGEGQTPRQSNITGWFNENTLVGNASIQDAAVLVQNRHSLTIGSGAIISTPTGSTDPVIVVENGGTLTLEGTANITGDIVVQSGAKLIIKEGVTITGDVHCAGDLILDDTGIWMFTLNTTQVLADEHGIFLYNHPTVGVATLTILGSPFIAGTSGKIHSFVSQVTIDPTIAGGIFCDDSDPTTHICGHFLTTSTVWTKQ